jgi:hypothetical protein
MPEKEHAKKMQGRLVITFPIWHPYRDAIIFCGDPGVSLVPRSTPG